MRRTSSVWPSPSSAAASSRPHSPSTMDSGVLSSWPTPQGAPGVDHRAHATNSRASWPRGRGDPRHRRVAPRSSAALGNCPRRNPIRPFPINPPGSARHVLLRYVPNQSGPLPQQVGKFVPQRPQRLPPAGSYATHPSAFRNRGYVPWARSNAARRPPDRAPVAHAAGGGRTDTPHAALRPPGGSPSPPPRGPPERQWGRKVPPRIRRCAVS